MTVKDIDRGYRRLFAQALKHDPHFVAVGIQGSKADEDHGGISNVRLAGVHEFGAEIAIGTHTVKIPERSFIRATVDAKNAYKEEIRALANRVLDGAFTLGTALKALGERVSSDMMRRIEKGVPPPNAASTIAAKGSSKPLIDSAQMKNSITYEVRRNVT